MKLLLVIMEGQLYLAGILVIVVAELGFLCWGLWSRRPIIGLVGRIGRRIPHAGRALRRIGIYERTAANVARENTPR